jgi:non-ribosomal peptide synthetase-like protein
LGARIGKNVHIHRGVDVLSGGWDLLDIGDNVTIGRDASLRLVDYQDQQLVLGRIRIGDRATVETRARLSSSTSMEEDSCLTSLSALPSGVVIPAGETWSGVPASFSERTAPAPNVTSKGRQWSPTAHGILLILMWTLLAPLTRLPMTGMVLACVLHWDLGATQVLDWLFSPYALELSTLAILAGLVLAGLMISLPLQALMVRFFGRMRPGVYSRWGWDYMVMLVKMRTLESAGNMLSGTLLWPTWLRLSGMRVGEKCEISSIMEVIPELTTVGAETFLADGIYLGAPRLDRGTVTCDETALGQNTFLGNHAVIPSGNKLPQDILLGVCTVADEDEIKPGTSWFGHPPFELPRREIVEADRSVTHEPAWYRYATRVFWEHSRFLLPLVPTLLAIAWFKIMSFEHGVEPGLGFFMISIPVITIAMAFTPSLLVLIMKWSLLGRVRPGQHPLWSCWCSRWDFLYVMWNQYARTMTAFEGTLFLAGWLRAMGARIGKRVLLGSNFAQVVDPDMLCFDDDATVSCMFQAHSFEDRVLKIGHVKIGERSTVGSGAVLLYGATIGRGTRVGNNSVVMKHEELLPNHYYIGCPTRPSRTPEPQ